MKIHSFVGALLTAGLLGFVSASADDRAKSDREVAPHPVCPAAAFLTLEDGKTVSVDWVEFRPQNIHSVEILTQSRIVDANIDIRSDQTAVRSSVVLSNAGEKPDAPKERNLGAGAIYWSDFLVSSVQQAIARAQFLGQAEVQFPAASLFSDSRGDVNVKRIDDRDWIVAYHNKRYFVLTDAAGCMTSAILPDFGVTIERRFNFPRSSYPLWGAYDAPPDHAYTAQSVRIPAHEGIVLAGTLTLPAGKTAAPAAIMITGLSPHERNEGAPPFMLFRDFADALTRAGIAVLRVDDRGIGESTGDHAPSTTFDEADDVRSEVAWLRSRAEIDPKRVFLVGHSEGSLIAIMIASQDPSIAGVVSLAGSGISGPQLAREQTEDAVAHDPAIAPADKEKEVEKELAEPLTPRERVFLTIDPLAYAAKVHCPTLILHGGSDITVPVRSAEKLAEAMRENGNPDVTMRIVAGVSHTLLPDPYGAPSGWPFLPAFEASPQVLDAMTDWVVKHKGPAG